MAQHYPEFFYVSTKDNFYVCGLKLLSATVYNTDTLTLFPGIDNVSEVKVESLAKFQYLNKNLPAYEVENKKQNRPS